MSNEKPRLSAKRLEALAHAREKALLSRRKRLKERLEKKLAELRIILGSDMRPDNVERVAHAMLRSEEKAAAEIQRLREKHIESNQTLAKEIEGMNRLIKEALGRSIKKKVTGTSEVSTSSRRG